MLEAERSVKATVSSAWEYMIANESKIKAIQDQVKANEIALDGVQKEEALGNRTILDVLDAYQELLNSKVNEVTARRDYYVSGMNLLNNPVTTSNVVTYEVIIEIDNKNLKLKPGMTANVDIVTAQKQDVWLAPNQALRFYVTDENGITKRYKDKGVWILDNGKPKRIKIATGVADDDKTEIMSNELNDKMVLIVEDKNNASAEARKMRMRMPR